MTERLKIWMLPTLALIKLEKTTDYVVGFDELGGVDDFQTSTLAVRLVNAGIIFENDEYTSKPAKTISKSVRSSSDHKKYTRTESDEDSDFDD